MGEEWAVLGGCRGRGGREVHKERAAMAEGRLRGEVRYLQVESAAVADLASID